MKKKTIILASAATAFAVIFAGCTNGKNNEANRVSPSTTSSTTSNSDNNAPETSVAPNGQLNKGRPSPNFTLTSMKDGSTLTLADLKGKKVAIKFWASWCSICKETLPESSALADDASKDFEFISVVAPDFSGEMSEAKFKEWYNSRKYNHMPVYFDKDGALMRQLGIRSFPSTATIGTDVIMVHFQTGHVSSEILKEAMAKIQ